LVNLGKSPEFARKSKDPFAQFFIVGLEEIDVAVSVATASALASNLISSCKAMYDNGVYCVGSTL